MYNEYHPVKIILCDEHFLVTIQIMYEKVIFIFFLTKNISLQKF